jgi:CheY-like chemotaxis protein
MDGFEAVQLYREFERNSKVSPIPIIAFTAQGLGSEQQKCLDVGMNGYVCEKINRIRLVSKPLKLKDLEKVLSEYLG